METEMDFINSVFTPDLFNVTSNGHHIFINSKDGDKNCLILKIIEDTIKIVELQKCNITGTLSLSLVEKLATIMPNIRYISLSDVSLITTNCGDRDGHKIVIDLATLKILTKGMSWYNSLGYYSPDFREEQRRNSEILRMSFEDVIQLCTIKKIDEFKRYNTVERLQKSLESLERRKILTNGEDEKIKFRILDLRIYIRNYPDYLSFSIKQIEEKNEMLIVEAKRLFPIDTSINIKEYVIKMLELINNRFDSSDELSCERYAFISNLFQVISSVLYYDTTLLLTKEINKPPVGGKSKKHKKTKSKKRRKTKSKKRFFTNYKRKK
jgi:hypothetical protein